MAMVTSTLHHCCSLFLLLLLLPLVPTVFTYTKDDCNILLNSPASVTDQDINPLFTSRSGEFSFGFRRFQINEKESQFLLAVWFTKTKDQTIVWSANGNEPAPQGSTLTQNSSSAFVLNDPNGNDHTQLIFTEAGYMYVQDANNSTNIFNITQEDPGSKDSFYHMARIDYDGVFRIYKHLRQQDTSCGSCPSTWDPVQGIPGITDICGVFDANTFVGGFCGLNGVCRTSDASSGGGTFCSCPYGFSQLNPYEDRAGCKPDFPLPNCDNGWEENKGQVSFVRLTNMDWPFTDYSLVQGANETHCKQQCLDDCMCVLAIYEKTGGYCWKKKYPLSNGRYSTNITRIAFIKVPNSFVPVKKSQSVVVVLALLLGSSAFLNILFFIASIVAIIYLHHRKLNSPWNIDGTLATNVRNYTYKELEEATRGFKHIVGKGKVVEEGEKEFKTEVSVIGQTHHKNLVRLLGYCDEGQHRLLVYEYMSNGSLANFLFGLSRPHWNQRVQIAFGIARGLITQIIHCDIKPQNILLDEYFTPRIADFGLAKLLLAEQTRAARTGIRGTIGYFAPE
uniref:Protein kinase domain-containing protein n=1 Tax=Quercus lobata TaxID=97700 RepID=A0A7N2LBS1_QUELO